MPLHLHAYCHITDARFDLPIRKLPLFQIIVSTSVAAGVMDATFDLVVLDEVSQATEGESLVPVSLVKPSGVVVLSGDPEQLGPVPRSPLFRAADMHLSLQERLLQHRIYENIRPYFGPDEEDGARVTERDMLCKFGVYLRHNYRSQVIAQIQFFIVDFSTIYCRHSPRKHRILCVLLSFRKPFSRRLPACFTTTH